MISSIKHQAKELLTELNRVDWPGKQTVLNSAYAVAVVSVFVAIYLYSCDKVISWLLANLLPHS